MMFLEERPRRLRSHPLMRDMVAENTLRLDSLIQPYFVAEGADTEQPIEGFTGISRLGIDPLSKRIEADIEAGVKRFLLFGNSTEKHSDGAAGYDENGLVPQALRRLRERLGKNALLITDVCLCPYTSHGHCGVLEGEDVDNDSSLEPLCKMAIAHAEAGADVVAPSDMMDGRVGVIRKMLDHAGYASTAILAYTAKFHSNYYGPFRQALDSAPQKGDRSTYQMDYRNGGEALRELRLDLAEGADMVMVKPALAYLDVIAQFRANSQVPVVAYSTSGEFEMVKQMARAGIADERKLFTENLTAIRRAGAHVTITYAASEMAQKGWLR